MFVMGIAGGTGSGKTTFTTTLINRFKDDITVIHHDNYYNILDHLTFEERCLVNYDHPDSFDTKLMIITYLLLEYWQHLMKQKMR